jgi:hypothetical protein
LGAAEACGSDSSEVDLVESVAEGVAVVRTVGVECCGSGVAPDEQDGG